MCGRRIIILMSSSSAHPTLLFIMPKQTQTQTMKIRPHSEDITITYSSAPHSVESNTENTLTSSASNLHLHNPPLPRRTCPLISSSSTSSSTSSATPSCNPRPRSRSRVRVAGQTGYLPNRRSKCRPRPSNLKLRFIDIRKLELSEVGLVGAERTGGGMGGGLGES